MRMKMVVWSAACAVALAGLAAGCGASSGGKKSAAGDDVGTGDGDTTGGDTTDDGTGDDGTGDTGDTGGDTTGGDTAGTDTGVDPGPIVNLLADTNRNGQIDVDDPTEDEGEDQWNESAGAVFLANLDDDLSACENAPTDLELPNCHDAADNVINGDDDHKDLAPLLVQAWPTAPDDATGTLSNSREDQVRVFHHVIKNNPLAWVELTNESEPFTAKQLREGIELAVEGRDIVRDLEVWDGYVDLTLTVTAGGETIDTDAVRMRVSPVMTYHHQLATEVAYAARFQFQSSVDFRTDLQTALDEAGIAEPLFPIDYPDQWAQDYFETGYMSMPAAGGGQHAIRVNYRSANLESPGGANPLRYAGKVVFEVLRGPDSAGIQQYTAERTPQEMQMDSLNSFGNTETIPPYSKDGIDYPLGRLYRGSVPSFYPDKSFSLMMEAQQQQPPVYVDTSWLLVGHVDETISFVRADNDYGWTIAANDAALAVSMLEQMVDEGNGNVPMFVGKEWDNNASAETTPVALLANDDVMEESAKAVVDVGEQLATLYEATGLGDADVLWVPFLHETTYGFSVAHQPGTVNGISLTPNHFAPPKPHGPKIDGVDVFEAQMVETWGAHDISLTFVEDWSLYHILLGEVHCGSNATREIPDVKWWETGR